MNSNPAAGRRTTLTLTGPIASEAVDRLGGNHAGDVRDYDEIHHHILRMADTLSMGIIKHFPRRLR